MKEKDFLQRVSEGFERLPCPLQYLALCAGFGVVITAVVHPPVLVGLAVLGFLSYVVTKI